VVRSSRAGRRCRRDPPSAPRGDDRHDGTRGTETNGQVLHRLIGPGRPRRPHPLRTASRAGLPSGWIDSGLRDPKSRPARRPRTSRSRAQPERTGARHMGHAPMNGLDPGRADAAPTACAGRNGRGSSATDHAGDRRPSARSRRRCRRAGPRARRSARSVRSSKVWEVGDLYGGRSSTRFKRLGRRHARFDDERFTMDEATRRRS